MMLRATLFACLVTSTFTAHALSPEAMRLVGQRVKGVPMTLSEVTAMPPVCQAIGMGEIDGVFWLEGMNKNGTLSILDRPENAMAKNAGWFHHYCWGMLEKNRAFTATNATKRAFQIKLWRTEMEFIVNWTAKEKVSWTYMPLVHKEIADSYVEEKDYANAVRAADKAIELNADYAPAYALLADVYEKLKEKDKALATVTEGLRHAPDSKGLQRRYKELGGKMPFPEPVVKPTPETAAEAPAPATTDDKASRSVEPTPAQPPGNPYCRFCP